MTGMNDHRWPEILNLVMRIRIPSLIRGLLTSVRGRFYEAPPSLDHEKLERLFPIKQKLQMAGNQGTNLCTVGEVIMKWN